MLEELIGHVIASAVRVVDGILEFFDLLWAGSRSLMENSRVGDSPLQAETRRRWDRFYERWFWLSLLLLGIAAALGVGLEILVRIAERMRPTCCIWRPAGCGLSFTLCSTSPPEDG